MVSAQPMACFVCLCVFSAVIVSARLERMLMAGIWHIPPPLVAPGHPSSSQLHLVAENETALAWEAQTGGGGLMHVFQTFNIDYI